MKKGVGEFTDIEITPTHASVTFKDRFTAEKFMNTPNSEIPSVGKVEMAWIQTPLPPVPMQSKSETAIKNDDDTHMEEGNAMVATSSPAPQGGEQDQQENLDYDVADDNDWGPE
jgi:RNA-binding protein 26